MRARRTAEGAPLSSALRNREFAALFVAHLLSLLGDRVASVAISVAVYGRSGSVLLAAAAYATSLLPWLLGAPFVAALADRWPRRRVMLACDAVRCGLVLLLAVPGLPLTALLVLLTAVAWLGPAFDAARAATLPVILDDEQSYVAGSALTMLSNQLSQAVGFAVGGLLLVLMSTQQALLLDSLSFALSGLLIAGGLRRRPRAVVETHEPLRAQVVAGAWLVFRDPVLRSVLLLAWLMAAVTVLPEGLAVAERRRLQAPGYATGLLMAAVPAGAAIGAVLLGRCSAEVRRRSMLPLSGLALAALAASAVPRSLSVVLLLWVLVGFGGSVQLPASALFMREVPDAFRNRAFGIAQTGLMAGQGVALLGAGAVAEAWDLKGVLLAAAGLGAALLAALAVRWPLRVAAQRTSPVDRWIAFVALVAVLTAAIVLQLVSARPAPLRLPIWLAALVFFATGSYVASLRIGRQAHVFQLDDIPRLVGLIFLTPAGLITARLLGALVALTVVRDQRGRKLVFNLASFTLEVSVALITFHALVPSHGIGPETWPAALLATILADLVSAWSVGVVIGLAEQDLRWRQVLRPDRMALATALGAATVGMIAATTLWYSPESSALVVVLVGLGMVGLRGFARLNAEGLEQRQLQELFRELGNLEPDRSSLERSLELIRTLLRVERLECLVTTYADASAFAGWYTVQAADCPLPEEAAIRDELGRRALADGSWTTDLHAAPVIALPELHGSWRQRKTSDTSNHRLAAALPGEHQLVVPRPRQSHDVVAPLGALVLTAKLGDHLSFTPADADLLRTVADPLGQALRRVEHRHQLLEAARHDTLTELSTLTELRTELGELLERDEPVAVLMINLGRLRAVNDVFGRDAGDQMIAAAARRLRATLPAGSPVGRVGGHHFACAVPLGDTTPRLEHASIALARRVRIALERPFADENTAELSAELAVNIGISLSPAHGDEPDLLLRRAEAAGDAAKEDPFGVAMFVDDLEQDVVRPLRLVTDLRAALNTTGQLTLHYQPKTDLRTGAVLGCEALIRWTHPELGRIGPDEFIPLAESTGLIGLITELTLDEALAQSARWSAQGLPSGVAVNLSARMLLDNDLVSRVANALELHAVDPRLLTLEITETSVMAQPLRSVLMLDALGDLGVQLSIDDFGTGYSNLSYLRQLPVQEVKLDRTFLSPLRGQPLSAEGGRRAYEFLRHAIALVHSLGLEVVVEGVEDLTSLQALEDLGADSAQGYFICRPQPAEEITDWMSRRNAPEDA